MLVLSRQKDQSIIVGDRVVVITVVDIRGDKVRLGVEAPKSLTVHREEVFDEIKKSKPSQTVVQDTVTLNAPVGSTVDVPGALVNKSLERHMLQQILSLLEAGLTINAQTRLRELLK